MGFWSCVCYCALFVSSDEQPLIVPKNNENSGLLQEEYYELSFAKKYAINCWRRKVQTESEESTLAESEELTSAVAPSIVDEPYNERVWKWFNRDFLKDVGTDYFDSETIYQSPDYFIKQLTQKTRRTFVR